ncbi:hypothetical protein GMO_18950 [Gluconobacter morbifer G707]|uniref:Uncharacterized protein n=1 Tax=Gluconobacter morbifer G707 TaxID=1088869 RepID=G6XK79_9PROT|nr:hypothetical protein GMO_18950 [Gluconobacter morbifer G707]
MNSWAGKPGRKIPEDISQTLLEDFDKDIGKTQGNINRYYLFFIVSQKTEFVCF